MVSDGSPDSITRRGVLTTISTTTVASGLVTASPGENRPDLPTEKEAFEHEQVTRYENSEIFRSTVEKHAGALLRAMHNDGYIEQSTLAGDVLRTASEGLVGVSHEGEYGAWYRDDEPKLLVKLPSESHDVVLHVHPETGERFASLDETALLKSTRVNDGNLTTTGCDICRTYVNCTDTPCETCTCQACIEYGKRIAREEFCCCSACGCTDCGYLAEEYCSSGCCNACEDMC